MADEWLQHWNNRFQDEAYAYGTQPNEFLEEQLSKLTPRTILFGAEGEGRNAVYAASLGWNVHAFDISIEGKKKALKLAEQKHVSIDYQVGLLPDLKFENEPFDVIALIYAHFPTNIRSSYHRLLDQKLKSGGLIILEGFGKDHLKYRNENPKVGGPRTSELLFSIDELKAHFKNYDLIQLEESEVELNEGLYHIGTGSVIRFIGRKK
jgi:SAM-dependent methyltransferase